ncbi:uncharacterized protein LOC133187340 [Saccostrea echinata]|uniref:uncharacterized protein LOC133187340 n=1 Tax=Saccostrea echinata TaxID=191078 RepID=UPI002A80A0D6|nr:uncharacterized protein LOC133187340 [Saccostrea echinata]
MQPDITTCIYDEKEELPLPEFHRKYKNKFPMLAIVVGGHYGPTKWDDLPSDIVMRIDRDFRQQRVLAKDPRAYREQYLSIPVNGPYRFNIVKSLKEKSQDQTLAEILEKNPLPVLVQFSTRGEVPKEGRGGPDGGLISFLIEYRYEEIYLQGNFYSNGAIAKDSASVTLCPLITMAPVYGLKEKTEEEYNQYLQRMTDYVNKKSTFTEETCNRGIKVLETSDPEIANIIPKKPDIDRGPAPALPKRRGSDDIKEPSHQGRPTALGQIPRLPDRQSAPKCQEPGNGKVQKNSKVAKIPPKPKPKPKTKPNPPVTKELSADDSDDEIYGDDYEVIDEDFKLNPPTVQTEKGPGYENDILCQVRPFAVTKTQDSDGESDEYEEITDKIPTPGENIKQGIFERKEPNIEQINIPQTDSECEYAEPEPDDWTEDTAQSNISSTSVPTEDRGQTKSNHVSGKTIKELGEILIKLKLGKFVDRFSEDLIDGEIVQDLTVKDLKEDYSFTKTEAIRLRKFIELGHVPM